MKSFFDALRSFFKHSTVTHLVRDKVSTPMEFIELVDRFVAGKLNYDLEWDDFISWPNDNRNLESIRDRLGEYEELLFSRDLQDRQKYVERVLEERNSLAAVVGLPMRGAPQHQ